MVYTIGYERASLDDFIATLRLRGVDTLVDIRERAQSRRKGFSKTALSAALSDAGISYIHLRELGDPKDGREAARRGDYVEFRKIFSKVMKSSSAKEAMQKIENLVEYSSICLMCYERDEKTCHRKIVSDDLQKKTGRKAIHLGVKDGAGKRASVGRVRNFDQGAAASL